MADKFGEHVKRIRETLQQLTESVDFEAFALSKKYEAIGEAMCGRGFQITIDEHKTYAVFRVKDHADYIIVFDDDGYHLVHTLPNGDVKDLYVSSDANQVAEEYRRRLQ